MTLYIVRHAVAVPRRQWDGPDLARPLDAEGQRQAEVVRSWFTARHLDRVLTSPSLRCTATVAAVADEHGLDLEKRRELSLDHEQAAVELARRLLDADGVHVVCSHGEIIRPILRSLRPATLDAPATSCAKGSIWVVTRSERGTTANYLVNADLVASV